MRIQVFNSNNKEVYTLTIDTSNLTNIEFSKTKNKDFYNISFSLNNDHYKYKTNKESISRLIKMLK